MVNNKERLINNYNLALNTVCDIIGREEVKKKMRKVIKLDISPRATKRHGICKYINNNCIIEVSKHLFEVDDKEMITTLIHEILHTFKDTKGHDYKWKWYVNKINNNTEYKITRTRNIEGIEMPNTYEIKIICDGCGNVVRQQRLSTKKRHAIDNKKCYCLKCKSHDFKIEKYIRYTYE